MTTQVIETHPVDEILPAPQMFVLGLQHVLVMYGGAVAVPLIIGGALGMSQADIAFLISADLFCCGLATMVQSIGLGKYIGIRLPVVMGVGFTGVAPIIAIGQDLGGVQWVYGAVLGSGLFTFLVAPYMSKLVRWFPPVVTGTVVLIIGISLMRVGIDWAAGGNPMVRSPDGMIPNPEYGLPFNLAMAAMVLAVILLIVAYAKGFISHLAVLFGLIVGYLVALLMGKINFGGIDLVSWFAVITPFHFGLPKFDLIAITTLCIVMIVMMVESTGVFLAVGEIVGRKTGSEDIARGLRADGLGNLISGAFNSFTFITFSQNVGLVQITEVRSRWVVAVAGGIMVLMGCFPKMGYAVAVIPPAVLGGAGIVMFGMIVAAGVKILTRVDFNKTPHSLYVVAVGVAIAMIPIVSKGFYAHMPDLAQRFLDSSILSGSFAALILNAMFNHDVRETEMEPMIMENIVHQPDESPKTMQARVVKD